MQRLVMTRELETLFTLQQIKVMSLSVRARPKFMANLAHRALSSADQPASLERVSSVEQH